MKPLLFSIVALIGLGLSTVTLAQGTQTTPCNATGATSTAPSGSCSDCTVNRTTNITSNFTVTSGQVVCVTAAITTTDTITVQDGGTLQICSGGSIAYGGGANNTYPIIIDAEGTLNNYNLIKVDNGNDNETMIINNGTINNFGEIEIEHGENNVALLVNNGTINNAASGLIDMNMGNDGHFYNCGTLLNTGEISMVGGNGSAATLVNCLTGIVMSYPGSVLIANGNGGNAGTIDNQGGFFCNQGAMCNDITLGLSTNQINCPSALPVELMNFQVDCDESNFNHTISWETASEYRSSYFNILKSANNVDWHSVATIPAAGNSTKLIKYSFEDTKFSPSISYYRLEQVDIDGYVRAYESVSSICNPMGDVMIFPNPNSGEFSLVVPAIKKQTATVMISNLSGAIVEQQDVEFDGNANMIHFASSTLANGVYFLIVKSDELQLSPIQFVKK